MSLNRALVIFFAMLAGSLHAQVLVSLGTTTLCGNLTGGQTCTLTAQVTGLTNLNVTWTFNPTVPGATLGPITPANAAGLTTRTYTAPPVVTARQIVSVTATASDGVTSAAAQITLVPPTVTILVSPPSVTLAAGQSQQFSATVLGISNTAVTWSISPQVGTITSSGFYTAPGGITASQKVTVSAISSFDGTSTGTATVTLSVPTTVSISISPTTVSLSAGQTQQFNATVTNATNTAVGWSVSPSTGAGTISASGSYTAPTTITVTSATITVQSVQDPSKTATASVTLSAPIGVGSGAPDQILASEFQSAYYVNGFNSLTSLPPLGQVKVLGAFTPTAYVQEFADANNTPGVKYALATSAPSGGLVTVYQIWSDVYAYYTSLGAATVGLPTGNTANCPFYTAGNGCTYQVFSNNYILFAYQAAIAGSTDFKIRNATATETFYTEWNSLGGFSGAAFPISAESATLTAAVVAPATAGSTYIVQYFSAGAIYAITSGPAKNTTHGVVEPFYDVYMADGGPTGQYGLPTGEAQVFQNGSSQQQFEGGLLQLQAGGTPVGQLPVSSVVISGASTSSTVNLGVGSSLTLTATPYDSGGNALSNRPVSWTSTNGLVIQIQASGQSAKVTAIAGGTANVTASSGGVTSAKVSFVVTSPCCQVGDGAPATVQSAFQNAIARDKLSIQVPVASPAQRVGSGYIQMVQGAGTPAPVYMLAQADQVGSAYVVSGALLAAYQSMGGPAGPLGYPTSDASAGGTQLFTGGQALAGNPVHVVSGPILAKWALLNYDAGTAGPPTGDATAFSTFGANSGVTQNFSGGAIYSATAGPLNGQSYFVTGLVLTTYNASGGASGTLGMPKSDEFVTGGVHQQNFEGGTISYTPGSATAQTQLAAKNPAVIVAPASIPAGGTANLAVAGFANGATVQVSVTGKSSFTVTTATGAYNWSMYIPLTAPSQTLSIHAADTGSTSTADGTLVIRGFDNNRVQLTKVQGDSQTAAPGSLLPVPLQVALLDASGTPVSGATVLFQPYPGVQLSAASAVTDSAGHASTYMRLPASVGTAGVTASAPNIAQTPVTFYALAQASSLPNFPSLQQSGPAALGNGTATIAQKGALLTAVAAILQYHQNRGDVPSPNGLANPANLNRFLIADCTASGSGSPVCDGFLANTSSGEQVVNLWRAADFTGGLDVLPIGPSISAVTDLAAQGEPVLLSLSLSLNGSTAGGHFVVATGINSDGSIAIQDPNPLFSRTNLNDYLNGFSLSGGAWQGSLVGVVRFAVRSPSATRFLMGAVSQSAALMANLMLNATSPAGACGLPVQMLDTVDASGNAPGSGPLVSQFLVCDGLQSSYQLSVGTVQPFQAFVTDLAKNGPSFNVSGSAPAKYQASRPLLNLALIPLSASFSAAAVVNAATFAAGISPGGLFSIFGSGLSGPGIVTAVDFDGVSAAILAASPFQINAQVPASVLPGTHVLRVQSAYGTVQQTVTVVAVAPGIFLVGNPSTPAVENLDGSLNTSSDPLPRGQALIIYATGLGTVVKQGQFSVTAATVTALLNGVEMPVSYAGLAPGYTGLYQVNLIIPAATPPGLGIPLSLKQAGQLSNAVPVSIQ